MTMIPNERVIRRTLAMRVVLFSVVLKSVDGNSQDACDRLYWHAHGLNVFRLREWVQGLERECAEARLFGALGFAAIVELGVEHGFDFGKERGAV